ncbi:hypothetical protein ACO0LG_08500 [Undibacterium sp. Ji42W]|uniref:hypothetical protein n=1 Tax=Undibacterium sp. Ji42W TaxID=3413039 RepID=UPI003BF3155C
MSAIIPFDFGAVPAYLQQTATSADAMLAHASKGMTTLSIKGKTFAIVRGKERELVMNPKDPESVAQYVEVVILKVSPHKAKVFYAAGYADGSDGKPDCMSNDGIKPDPTVPKPQCSTCAACPRNVWGSKIGENGNKGKACQDSIRIAVAPADKLDDAMLVRIPPATIKNLADYGKLLKQHGVGPAGVVTRMAFDNESPTPLLTFKPVGFLSQEQVTEALEISTGDKVQNIIGGSAEEYAEAPQQAPSQPVAAQAAAQGATAPKITQATKEVREVEVIAAVQEAVLITNAANKAADTDGTPTVVTSLEDIDLDNLSFD